MRGAARRHNATFWQLAFVLFITNYGRYSVPFGFLPIVSDSDVLMNDIQANTGNYRGANTARDMLVQCNTTVGRREA